MFRLPQKKNLLGLYGEEPRELFTTKLVEVQQISLKIINKSKKPPPRFFRNSTTLRPSTGSKICSKFTVFH